MTATERRQCIGQLLRENGSVRVADLSARFDVSEVTVRTDLTEMEDRGMLTRVHGGAVNSGKPYYSMDMDQRLGTNQPEKQAIARRIAALVEPNDVLMFNSGTTTLLTFRMLPADYNLRIVTNSVAIALEAAGDPRFSVILIGGAVNARYRFTYGSDAVRQLQSYHADKLILSADGLDTAGGITTWYDREADVDRTMLAQSDRCIVAADGSKFRRNAFVRIAELEAADLLVTDARADGGFLREAEACGIRVLRAE